MTGPMQPFPTFMTPILREVAATLGLLYGAWAE